MSHARRDHPDEACGVLVGLEGFDRPQAPHLNGQR
ncbi:hypothetical protein [Mycobacterium leprae]|nr:hypothetical protein [Mycobacterium leprae]